MVARSLLCVATLLLLAFATPHYASAQILCPDGTYVSGNPRTSRCAMAPDGSYVSAPNYGRGAEEPRSGNALTGLGEGLRRQAERDRQEEIEAQRRKEENERYQRELQRLEDDRRELQRVADELYLLRLELERQRTTAPARSAEEFLDEPQRPHFDGEPVEPSRQVPIVSRRPVDDDTVNDTTPDEE